MAPAPRPPNHPRCRCRGHRLGLRSPHPGEGRVHACLRHQLNFISEACRAEENKLATLEYRDIRLRPKLAKVGRCARARARPEAPPCPAPRRAAARRARGRPRRGAVRSPAPRAARARATALAPPAPRPPPRPPLQVCSEERAVFCKDVKPGKARVIKCLMEAMDKPNFGGECRAELRARSEVVKSDYRWGRAAWAGPLWGI
jgi:Golgi apparatus protein 1